MRPLLASFALALAACAAEPGAEPSDAAAEAFVPPLDPFDAGADASASDAIDGDVAPPKTIVTGGVMMQGFYWNVPRIGWWKLLRDKAPELAKAGIRAMWIPPPSKGASGLNDVGYGIYDPYDLGEFDQKGTVATRYGTRAELESAIAALHDNGIAVYADVVMNHRMGGEVETFVEGAKEFTAPSKFRFTARGGAHSSTTFGYKNFNGCHVRTSGGGTTWVQWSPWDFAPSPDRWDNLLGCELKLRDVETQQELVRWGKWLNDALSLDGYRLDAVKHIHTPFLVSWLDQVKGPRFAVAEAWFGDRARLTAYADEIGGRAHLFDVPLHYTFSSMSQMNGAFDMRGLRGAGFVAVRPSLAVTFVDNHDTDVPGALHSPVERFKLHAYAYVLLRDRGVPCIFWKDWYEYGHGAGIAKLLEVRQSNGFGEGREHDESDADVYVYERLGDASHAGLLLLLNDGAAANKKVKTSFVNTTLVEATGRSAVKVTTGAAGTGTFPVGARDLAVWVPAK